MSKEKSASRIDDHTRGMDIVFNESLLDSRSDLSSQSTQLVRGHLDMVGEVEVAGSVERHKVDVHMGHVDTYHGFAYFNAGTHFFEPTGNFACKEVQLGVEFFVEVEDIVDFLLWNAEDMSADDGVDVEECEAVFCFSHLIAGDLTRHDFTEDCHSSVGING